MCKTPIPVNSIFYVCIVDCILGIILGVTKRPENSNDSPDAVFISVTVKKCYRRPNLKTLVKLEVCTKLVALHKFSNHQESSYKDR